MNATQRLYRTAQGDLVTEGNPAAAFLAYAEGDEIAREDESKVPGAKSRKPVANKLAAKPEDKTAKEPPKARGK